MPSTWQAAAWEQLAPKLKLTKRPLRYSLTAWDHTGRAITWNKGEEKGIDVLLALSMAPSALRTGRCVPSPSVGYSSTSAWSGPTAGLT